MIIIAIRNVICLIGLLLMLPLLLIASFFIYLEDGLPLFFKQQRLGLHKKLFTIYKIRTLIKHTPDIGTHELEDSYKLRVGKVIRALKLDEFPQLLNVLKGQINLIGPRPGLESQIELAQARAELSIFNSKPGITGLAQVLGYDMENPVKLAEIDKVYIINKSVALDIVILIATFTSLPKTYLAKKLDIMNINKTNKN
jgi:O-antigen biosynthesis protein WbqP